MRQATGEPAVDPSSAARPWVALLAALTIVSAAYSNALAGPFIWDDVVLIQKDPAVHELRAPQAYFGVGFWKASPQGNQVAFYYRPMVVASYALDWRAWGDPWGFHLTNVLAHLAVCWLVFALARRLGATPVAAALATVIFGAFPRATENVTWISGRTDVIAALGGLGALLLWRSGPGSLPRRAAAAGALLLGLLAKEVAIAAAVAISVQTVSARRSEGFRRVARELAPLALAVLAYLALRLYAIPARDDATGDPIGIGRRIALPFDAVGRYAAMLLDPLRPRFGIGLFPFVEPAFVAGGGVIMVLLAWIGLRAWRRSRPDALGVAALGITSIALVLHVLPIRISTLACDRFLYLPVAALAALGSAAGARATNHFRRPLAAGAAAVGLAFVVATHQRNALWADDLRLWSTEAARADPRDAVTLAEYGGALFRKGRFEEALPIFRKAGERFSRLGEEFPRLAFDGLRYATTNVATTLSELGRFAEAIPLLEQVVRWEPDVALHHYNLGVMVARTLDLDRAEAEIVRALELYPDYPDARAALDLVRAVRVELSALPPESPHERVDVTARRAEIHARLGRWTAARSAWAIVLAAPDAARDQVREAALFMVRHGAMPDAEAALERLAVVSAEDADLLRPLLLDRRLGRPPSG